MTKGLRFSDKRRGPQAGSSGPPMFYGLEDKEIQQRISKAQKGWSRGHERTQKNMVS